MVFNKTLLNLINPPCENWFFIEIDFSIKILFSLVKFLTCSTIRAPAPSPSPRWAYQSFSLGMCITPAYFVACEVSFISSSAIRLDKVTWNSPWETPQNTLDMNIAIIGGYWNMHYELFINSSIFYRISRMRDGPGRIEGYFFTLEKSKFSRFFKLENFQKMFKNQLKISNFEKIFKFTYKDLNGKLIF